MQRIDNRIIRWLFLAITTPTLATAQAKPSADSIARLVRKLQEAQTDPTAPALTFTHGFTFIPAYYGDEFSGKTGSSYQVTVGVPFTLWGKTQIIRTNVSAVLGGPETFTAPSVTHVITGSRSTSSGLYRRWAVGTRFEAEAANELHGHRALAGPEVELFGELTKFALAGVAVGGLFGRSTQLLDVTPTLQLAYGAWSIGTGKTLEWDFKAHEVALAPISLTLAFTAPIEREYYDFFLTPIYQLSRDPGEPKWAIELGVVLAPRWFSTPK